MSDNACGVILVALVLGYYAIKNVVEAWRDRGVAKYSAAALAAPDDTEEGPDA